MTDRTSYIVAKASLREACAYLLDMTRPEHHVARVFATHAKTWLEARKLLMQTLASLAVASVRPMRIGTGASEFGPIVICRLDVIDTVALNAFATLSSIVKPYFTKEGEAVAALLSDAQVYAIESVLSFPLEPSGTEQP